MQRETGITQRLDFTGDSLRLGSNAIQLLKEFGVHTSFHLSPEALHLAALETVQLMAAKHRAWAEIDTTLAGLRKDISTTHTNKQQELLHIEAVYEATAAVQAQKIKAREIFPARDAAQRFAAGYWRYTPEATTQQGVLLKSNLRRAGARFRPMSRMLLEIEGRLPFGVQRFLANRRTA